jgi:hypothetical protein
MPNSLGTLAEFEIDPMQDHTEVCGMRGATGYEGGNRPPVRNKLGLPTSPEPAEVRKPLPPPPPPATIPELLADTEKALANYERHNGKRDLGGLEEQIRGELLSQLVGYYVAAELARAMDVLRGHYDRRWRHSSYLRTDAYRFASVTEARKLHGRLAQARGADFLPVAKEIFELCKELSPEPVSSAEG